MNEPLAIKLIAEIYASHREPKSEDSDWSTRFGKPFMDLPCRWCEQAKSLLDAYEKREGGRDGA